MSLDFRHNGFENLFNEALRNEITLFCGAGFSVNAKNKKGQDLPVGERLLNELKVQFPTVEKYTQLPKACTKIINEEKVKFYEFIADRFTVGEYADSYNVLKKLKIPKVYTTNVDDLFFAIFNENLNDCSVNGEVYKIPDTEALLSVNYYPLHGCVRNTDDYVFGATEIASAFSVRSKEKSWKSLTNDSNTSPMLFWGWNFEDAGPIEAMFNMNEQPTTNLNRWILLYEPDDETLDFLLSLNFNIILGDTTSMLEYIREVMEKNLLNEATIHQKLDNQCLLEKYQVPKKDTLASIPFENYFLNFSPEWYHIYSGFIPKTSNFNLVSEKIAMNKDVVVFGLQCCGKSTLLRQLLTDYSDRCLVHYLLSPTKNEVQQYLKALETNKSLVFVDDCFRDTEALRLLLKNSQTQVVAFDRDFRYEGQFHNISEFDFEALDVTNITQSDAQKIIESIPKKLRYPSKGTQNIMKDPTILNVVTTVLKPSTFNFFERYHEQHEDAAKLFLMISYVHSCGVPCSFDMIYSFLGDDAYTYQEMFELIDESGGLLQEASDWYEARSYRESIEDYYKCRSRFFAEKMIKQNKRYREILGSVLFEFTSYVPVYKICFYDQFRRSAYDADLTSSVFTDVKEGEKFYFLAEKKDGSEYLSQQAALYFSRLKDFDRAFHWIEKGKNYTNYNRFSIDSTYAIKTKFVVLGGSYIL